MSEPAAASAARCGGVRRRDVLAAAGAAAVLGPAHSHADTAPDLWSAWLERAGPAADAVATAHAGRTGTPGVALPERAHDVQPDPRHAGMAYVVARRPGSFLWRVDGRRERIAAQAMQDETRRFEGHALCSAAQLFTTETDTDSGDGLLGRRDADSLQLRDEWPTHGIGPHQLLQWPAAGDALVVANGGILTLPQTGRAKLNLDTMRSTLALLDPADGRLRGEVLAPHARLSLRHLAVADDGTLGVAMQFEDRGAAPVLALLSAGQTTLREVQCDAPLLEQLRSYAGAIAAHGDLFAVTCPRGDRVVVWDSAGRLRAAVPAPAVCGIARCAQGWWLSSEHGGLYVLHADGFALKQVAARRSRMWDNHLAAA